MNLTKGMKRKFILLLFEANQLIDESHYASSKRIINDIIFELDQIENDYEDWRTKYGQNRSIPL